MIRPTALARLGVLGGALLSATTLPAAEQTLLLRDPTVSDTRIAFVHAGDLWSVDRDGDDPRRLTTDPTDDSLPAFSPDGTMIAFTRDHAGNQDVHVMPAAGGTPTRLTWHPADDRVTGWSADGTRVLFASGREVAVSRSFQPWEVSPAGGPPEKVMDADFLQGRWNGDVLAYTPFVPGYNGLLGGSAGWKGYRGGTTPSIHLLDVEGESVEVIPGERVTDLEPMWDGGDLYFVSDREDEAFNVYAWDADTESARRLTDESDWDVRAADAHDGTIVFEAGGRLKELDLASGAVREIVVSLHADLPQTRPQWKDASKTIESVALSPTGRRAVVTARGEVFTVPVDEGSTRNLTTTDGRREYTGLWSPDGGQVAFVIQEADRQVLALVDQDGLGEARTLPLGDDFFELRAWSGDGGRIAYTDNHLGIWTLDLEDGERTRIDTLARRERTDLAFSPDGRWLAYTLERPNHLRDLMLRDLASDETVRVSDGMADVSEVAFAPDGAWLWFTASTNSGPAEVGLDLSSQEQNLRAGVYAVALAADGASPMAPRPGDEPVGEDAAGDEDTDGDERAPTRVDLDGIQSRIAALTIAERRYTELVALADGDLLLVDAVQPGASNAPDGEREQAGNRLQRWDLEARELATVTEGIVGVSASADGKHLIARDAAGAVVVAEVKEKIDFEPLDTSGMRLFVDPRAEWAQIFEDAVRMQRAWFYADNDHGLDWDAVADRYRPLVAHVGRRRDLNDVIVEMIAELQAGHNRAGGGDLYREEGDAPAGLLGADLRVEDGRWTVARVLDGGSWTPFLHAPLAAPGVDVDAGDVLLAIDGVELTGEDNVWRRLQGTVGRQVTVTVADDAHGGNRREVLVEPVDDEGALREWAWIDERHARVREATDGRVGYVYLPNTTTAGYRMFNRMFFAQADAEALIVDERSNSGGQAANYVTDVLSRTYLASWKDRDGLPFDTPGGAVFGPKVMLIDQYAGSGGDFLPYAFRREGLGPLIGTRTWGGLIGIAANPAFVDGGRMTVPFFRFYTPDGEWRVENEGVAPDIRVRMDPVAVNRGEDPQLEVAIDEVMRRLADHEPVRAETPPLPTEPGE
jgi:tricorn protease